ncbi:phage/plasmid primase, P4 family [Microbacterium laevaniformans]|uniref:phage/plasmid primase, P4 family n=1 Tax=Microbacterium laevaniformans TaxID=36807 RepID=UPI003D952B62
MNHLAVAPRFEALLEALSGFNLHQTGPHSWRGRCPACGGSNSSKLSLTASSEGRILINCFSQACTKDALLSKLEELGFSRRVIAHMTVDGSPAAPRASRTAPPLTDADLAKLYSQVGKAAARLHDNSAHSREVLAYARGRWGILPEQATDLGLGAIFVHDAWRVVVPLYAPTTADSCMLELRGYQARAITPIDDTKRWTTLKNPENGARWTRLAVFDGDSHTPDLLTITEGPGDSLALRAAGFLAAAFRGASMPDANDARLLAQWAVASGVQRVVIIADTDGDGLAYATAVADLMAGNGLAIARADLSPLAVKDAAELWAATAAAGGETREETYRRKVEEVIADATWVPEEHDQHPSRETEPSGATPASINPAEIDDTDVGAARTVMRTAVELGQQVRYCEDFGFLAYDPTRGIWDAKEGGVRVRLIAHTIGDKLRAAAREARQKADAAPDTGAVEKAKKAKLEGAAVHVARLAARFASSRSIDAMLKELRAIVNAGRAEFDDDATKHLLVVKNGVVDLRTGSLTAFDPSLMITRAVDVAYRPDASAPRWQQFLGEVFPDTNDDDGNVVHSGGELARYMQTLAGVGLSGDVEQILVFLVGKGRNGKSLLLDLLREILGQHAESIPFSALEAIDRPGSDANPNVAKLEDVRLAVASEVKSDSVLDEGTVKNITGGEAISPRKLHSNPRTWVPRFLVLVAANTKPRMHGAGDYAIWERLKVVPFDRVFAPHERDLNLKEKLRAEREGILAWMVEGAKRWYAEGLTQPARVTEEVAAFKADADPLDEFFTEVYVPVANKDARVKCADLYDDFQYWCHIRHRANLRQWSSRKFYAEVKQRDIVQRTYNGYPHFYGLGVTDAWRKRAEANRF